MEDRPWLYYKLTNEPKGSGELKNLHFGENFIKIRRQLGKLFTVKHSFSDGFYGCEKDY